MRLTLFYAAGANCNERVRWALDYKRVSYELIDLDRPFDAVRFAAASPFGRSPVMEVDGRPLSESMAMLELIEELHPEPPLTCADPWLRARVREVCEAINSSIHPVQNSSVVGRLRPDWDKAAMRPFRREWIAENLNALAPKLWRESGYAVGERFSLADILVAVMARKARALGGDALPAFEHHWQHLMAQPAVASSCPASVRAEPPGSS